MIIYSVTVTIQENLSEDWLKWMQGKHIPDVMQTGLFLSHDLRKLLDPAPDKGMVTFNIQYEAKNMENLELYKEKFAPGLQKEHSDRYEDRFVSFRTLLEKIT